MIDRLLDKFYAGETSPSEEQELLRLLRASNDPKYDADRRTLDSLSPEMPDFRAMARRVTKTRRPALWRNLSIAASVAIVLIAGGSLLRRQPAAEETLTVDEAREQTIMALMTLTEGIDKGYTEILKLQDL